jgi:hypothetical protein
MGVGSYPLQRTSGGPAADAPPHPLILPHCRFAVRHHPPRGSLSRRHMNQRQHPRDCQYIDLACVAVFQADVGPGDASSPTATRLRPLPCPRRFTRRHDPAAPCLPLRLQASTWCHGRRNFHAAGATGASTSTSLRALASDSKGHGQATAERARGLRPSIVKTRATRGDGRQP